MDIKDFERRAWAVMQALYPEKARKVLKMKLCRECVFLSPAESICTHDSGRDLVNGQAQMPAERNRYGGPCGEEGRFWKPKPIDYPGGPSE